MTMAMTMSQVMVMVMVIAMAMVMVNELYIKCLSAIKIKIIKNKYVFPKGKF